MKYDPSCIGQPCPTSHDAHPTKPLPMVKEQARPQGVVTYMSPATRIKVTRNVDHLISKGSKVKLQQHVLDLLILAFSSLVVSVWSLDWPPKKGFDRLIQFWSQCFYTGHISDNLVRQGTFILHRGGSSSDHLTTQRYQPLNICRRI